MSEAQLALLCSPANPLGFAVRLDEVDHIVAASELPETYRSVEVQRLFDNLLEALPGEVRCYARLIGFEDARYLGLGSDVRVRRFRADRETPIPAVFAATASRWRWSSFVFDEGRMYVVVDGKALATLGSRKVRAVSPAAAETLEAVS